MSRSMLVLALAGLAMPAVAQPLLVASPATAPSITRVVARETLWSCAGGDCRAPRSGRSSDINECRAVARKIGRLTGFTAAGKPFDAGQLERCNAGTAQ